jgi:hypothetical protein
MLKRFHSRSGWMIKLSPLFDLKEVERKFEFLKEIHIISENNEVKEVCVILDKENHYELRTIAVDLGINHFQYQSGNASSCKENWDIKENQYLYIPFACLVKAGLDSEYLSSFHLEKLAHYSLYFSSENLQIPGTRKYRIRHVGSLSHKVLASHLKLLETRDFNLVLKGKGNRANWMKVLKLKEGSENLLFILNERRKLSLMAEFIRT